MGELIHMLNALYEYKVKLDEPEEGEYKPKTKLLDARMIAQFYDECLQQAERTEINPKLSRKYKKFLSQTVQANENSLVTRLDESKRNVYMRESSRLFEGQPEQKEMRGNLARIVNWNLENLKRESKDQTWIILTYLIYQRLMASPHNLDLLEIVSHKRLPNDFRQVVWKLCLVNKPVSNEYRELFLKSRVLTISQFDIQITKDADMFVRSHADASAFTGNMFFAIKTILSYFEKKLNRILSDYHYLLCIPLVVIIQHNMISYLLVSLSLGTTTLC
eukprot:TRINITY_DN5749_c0_g1_i2.p1 TRINITY_DN5749_c0_g1~~TRINITY_DN5749_c0_g1_i2.p1  ORF type:complete len:276 (-),score=70.19 TRINITY_DN5749_c0_g1_i2:523-1350(-)